MKKLLFFLTLVFFSCHSEMLNQSKDPFIIDFGKEAKELNPFWTATGFSPASLLEEPEMQQVVFDVGQLPDKGIQYIRPHFLLNLVTVDAINSKNPIYNWSRLDGVLDIIVQNDLKLIFELMGLPSKSANWNPQANYRIMKKVTEEESEFYDLSKPEIIRLWKTFVRNLILHLQTRYGKEEVGSWYFETTNEPDLDIFWDYDIPTFLNYYDACSEGIKEVDPAIRFGGPGTANDLSPHFIQLLAHCDTGTNYFTGEKGVRLDFISIHAKDDPYDMLNRALNIVNFIRENHPRFRELPFFNDEADPIAGWKRNLWWRRGPWYAAFVAQNIDIHQKILIDSAKVNFIIQSNDHTFLGNWHNRTTHTLQYHPENKEEFRLIPKPVLTIMNSIAKLGESYVDVEIPDSLSRHFGILATKSADTSVVIMAYNKTDFDPDVPDWGDMPETTEEQLVLMEKEKVKCSLSIENLPFKKFTLREYRFDQNHSNPHQKWIEMGSPDFLEEEEFKVLLESCKAEIIQELRNESTKRAKYKLELELPSPGVSFFVLVKN